MILARWSNKVHGIYRPYIANMTKCRGRNVPKNAIIWEGKIEEITCRMCIRRVYDPKPNKLARKR
jgi:hypothetical protein